MRPGRVAARALVAVIASLALLAGCGGAGPETADRPFGDPPPAVPGIHAWAAGEAGVLLVTADGGASWMRREFFLPQRGVDVAFADAQTGWLVTDAGTVLATTDGGTGWTVVEQAELTAKAIAATDSRRAWIVGSPSGAADEPGASAVLRTTDGGEVWRRTGFGTAQLADVAFADERRGVLVALDRIWSTRDGGRTWRLRRELPMTVLTSVAAGDPRRFWVAGWGTQLGDPLVFATRDGGATWRRLRVDVAPANPGELQARQIACAGESLWITCAAGVLASADGGRTWELQQVPAGQPLAIAAADEEHVLATTGSQPILASADGGATWRAFGSEGFLEQPLVAIDAVVAQPAQ
ncbi:MAG TPA: YCF48-related protein [Thermoleophilia bacterium]|nr:YCF48-related protein [Thermoleophilia bacterium]